ncbi:effector-associated constant component EACC1 [Spirillospora sp. CA-255316]
MDVVIRVDGEAGDTEALRGWLLRDPVAREAAFPPAPPAPPGSPSGTMGALEVINVFVANGIALGSLLVAAGSWRDARRRGAEGRGAEGRGAEGREGDGRSGGPPVVRVTAGGVTVEVEGADPDEIARLLRALPSPDSTAPPGRQAEGDAPVPPP